MIFTGITDAERLINVYEAWLLPFLRDCYPDGHRLQQDNDPKHASWPGISKDLETEVKKCTACCKAQMLVTEPLIPTKFPQLPWQRVGTDLFKYNASKYVLVVDYFSHYIEIAKLSSTDTNTVVNHLKSIFARHGIPQVIISDNGPQYYVAVFSEFAEDYGFVHMTSSPKYSQANGEAERAVRTIKSLLKKCSGKAEDPYLALMAY